jgi:hypothetical protein
VPRLAIPRSAALRRARLVAAACLALGGGPTLAQTAPPDWLAPGLVPTANQPPTFQPFTRRQPAQTDRPPAFQPFTRRQPSQTDQPTTFKLPPSGVGVTGFDATNARKRTPALRPGLAPAAMPLRPALTPAALPLTVASAAAKPAPPRSPYAAPIPPLPGEALASAMPGEPPVELGPIRRPPKKHKAHADEPTDPYEPTGIHVGSFLLYPAIEFIGGYNNNPGATPGGSGAALYTIAPELLAQSEWSRHSLKAELRGSYTGYSPDQTPTLSRPYLNGKVDGRFDVSRDTHILLGSRVLVSTDNPGSPNLQAGLAKLPVFVTYGGGPGLEQKFNRFAITAKADFERTSYQHSVLTDGSTVSNTDRNYNQIGGKLRGSYEILPGVKPFVEADADKRVHDTEFDDSGYARNSKGVTGLIGSSFELKRDLTGEIAVGYTKRTYEDARLSPLEGLVGDASLIWTADALNTVKLSATSTAGESTIAGVSGVLSRDIGLQLDHAFRRWLILSLKLGYGWDVYQGSEVDASSSSTELCGCVVSIPGGTSADRVDKRYSAAVDLTYKLNRSTQIKGELRQDWLRSNVAGVDYTASTALLGIRFQR